MSLLGQGATIGPLLRLIMPKTDPAVLDEQTSDERRRIIELMRTTAESVPEPPAPAGDPTPAAFFAARERQLAVIAAQRSALLDSRDNGTFDADVLTSALATLDASQIAIEMRGQPTT